MDLEASSFDTEPLGDAICEDAIDGLSSSSSRKRGPTQGRELNEKTSLKRVITTNEFGQPNAGDINQVTFNSCIGVLTRTHIPITYTDFRQVPPEHPQRVIESLECSNDFQNNQHAMTNYVREHVNTSWRKYVKDKDPAVVKSSLAPIGVPIEDWILFVDQRNTNEFKELSARNASNRAKQVGPSTLGRRSMAVIRHQMAIERNVSSDAEVGRADVYIRAHTTKDDKLQFPEAFEKIKSIQSRNPVSRMTNVDDALTQSIGSDSRGCMRGIGGNVGKIALRKTIPIIDKLNMMAQDRDNLREEVSEMKKSLVDLHMKVNCIVEKQGEQGVADPPAIPPFKSSRVLSPNLIHIGKRCDLCDWKKRVVARGEVHEVDPTAHVHGSDLGEGNFRVVLIEIKASHVELWKEDGYHHALGEVGVGAFVLWPKLFLTIYP